MERMIGLLEKAFLNLCIREIVPEYIQILAIAIFQLEDYIQ